ncbi:MAG: hypothetical protein QNJ44_08980 [Rhodobacter sp.]|nr:hypothetical protein [Rhodobacter sp.]
MSARDDTERLVAATTRPAWAGRIDALLREKRIELDSDGGHLLALLTRPTLADEAEVQTLGADGRALIALQSRLITKEIDRVGRDGFLDLMAVPDLFRRFVNWDELCDPAYLVGRLDLLETDRGFICCEINVDSCVAGAEIYDVGRDVMQALGLPDTRLPSRPLDDLAALVAERAEAHEAGRIVILDWSVGGGTGGKGYLSFERMRAAVARQADCPVHIADELSFDPAWLGPETFVHRGFMMEEISDDGRMLDRLLDAGTPVYSTFEADIRMDKVWFARFWEARRNGALDEEETALVDRFVPESWELSEDRLDAFLARKDELIFKIRRAFGGKGILIGAEESADSLRAEIRRSSAANWIAQAMLAPLTLDLPDTTGGAETHELVYGLYLYGRRANGFMLRGSTRSRVVNVSIGNARINWAMALSEADRNALIAGLEATA